MKRLTSILLALSLTVSLVGCGGSSESKPAEKEASVIESAVEDDKTESEETVEEEVNEDDLIDDPEWDQLEALGNVETENGIFTVKLTLPADFVGEETTQEELDAGADKDYISAKLNDDGSVTYKMTKKQHKAMLEEFQKSIEESMQEIVDSEDYTISEIEYNSDLSQFDVKLEGAEMGFADAFAVYLFYMESAIFGIYSGKTPEDIVVNYYDPEGNLVETLNSADMEQ